MTDKKRGRPTVKKKDEHHITGCSLPPARVCIDYLQTDIRDYLRFPWLCDNAQFDGQTINAFDG